MGDDVVPKVDVDDSDEASDQRHLETNKLIRDALTRPPSPAVLRLLDALKHEGLYPGTSRPVEGAAVGTSAKHRSSRPDRVPTKPTESPDLSTPSDDSFTLRVVVDYCNGATQQQIADSRGVHVQTIRKVLRDAGVVVREHRATFTHDEIAAIQAARSQGVSARELGRRYNVAHTTILRLVRPTT